MFILQEIIEMLMKINKVKDNRSGRKKDKMKMNLTNNKKIRMLLKKKAIMVTSQHKIQTLNMMRLILE